MSRALPVVALLATGCVRSVCSPYALEDTLDRGVEVESTEAFELPRPYPTISHFISAGERQGCLIRYRDGDVRGIAVNLPIDDRDMQAHPLGTPLEQLEAASLVDLDFDRRPELYLAWRRVEGPRTHLRLEAIELLDAGAISRRVFTVSGESVRVAARHWHDRALRPAALEDPEVARRSTLSCARILQTRRRSDLGGECTTVLVIEADGVTHRWRPVP